MVISNKSLLAICFLLVSDFGFAAEKSFKAAINAKELLVLMSACDMLPVAKQIRHSLTTLNEMCEAGKLLLKFGMSGPGPTAWIWQPGKMRDHDDYKYAGNAQLALYLEERKVEGISMDSSHFYAKWPLFFLSALQASSDEQNLFFSNAIAGLINNLFKNVVSVDNDLCVVKYRNYTDGTNGVYRWNWQWKGPEYGHSEYGLSYTPFFSALALLDDDAITAHYQKINSCYPYSSEIRKKFFWSRKLESERLLIELSGIRPRSIKANQEPPKSVLDMYQKFFHPKIIKDKLLSDDEAYALMVGDTILVMHYAFYYHYQPWLDDFYVYAKKISQMALIDNLLKIDDYKYLHLIYYLSRYWHMYALENSNEPVAAALQMSLIKKLEDLYLIKQPDVVSNPGWDDVKLYDYKSYVDWKLSFYRK